jgi:hypothetical protein
VHVVAVTSHCGVRAVDYVLQDDVLLLQILRAHRHVHARHIQPLQRALQLTTTALALHQVVTRALFLLSRVVRAQLAQQHVASTLHMTLLLADGVPKQLFYPLGQRVRLVAVVRIDLHAVVYVLLLQSCLGAVKLLGARPHVPRQVSE